MKLYYYFLLLLFSILSVRGATSAEYFLIFDSSDSLKAGLKHLDPAGLWVDYLSDQFAGQRVAKTDLNDLIKSTLNTLLVARQTSGEDDDIIVLLAEKFAKSRASIYEKLIVLGSLGCE